MKRIEDVERIESRTASRGFSDLVSRIRWQNARFVITRRGKDVAAVVPVADLQRVVDDEELHELIADAAKKSPAKLSIPISPRMRELLDRKKP